MSFDKNSNTLGDLREEYSHHASSASYYFNAYIEACAESEHCHDKWKEHKRLADEAEKSLKENFHVLSF